MASFVYGKAPAKAFNKEIDWNDGNVKVMLVGAGYTPDKDAHEYLSSVTNEVTGTGYTAGGVALANPTVTYNAAADTTVLDGDDTVIPNASVSARAAVVYYNTGNPATSPLLAYEDFGALKTSTDGDFRVTWDATGIVVLAT